MVTLTYLNRDMHVCEGE